MTTLEDGTEPGTLRYALSVATGPRTVIFDVGGVITTTSRLTVSDKYVTVAAQTAPGKGIVIQGMPVGLSGESCLSYSLTMILFINHLCRSI